MKIAEVLEEFEKNGLKMTRQRIHRKAEQWGASHKEGERVEFDDDFIRDWIKSIKGIEGKVPAYDFLKGREKKDMGILYRLIRENREEYEKKGVVEQVLKKIFINAEFFDKLLKKERSK